MAKPKTMSASDREGAIARIDRALADRDDVVFASVFGSFVDQDVFRDVDVGVWTTGGADGRVQLDLAAELTRQLRLPVDVRRLNDAPVSFLFHALRGRLIAVRDELFVADLMEQTARRYHDIEPLLRRATREAFAR